MLDVSLVTMTFDLLMSERQISIQGTGFELSVTYSPSIRVRYDILYFRAPKS